MDPIQAGNVFWQPGALPVGNYNSLALARLEQELAMEAVFSEQLVEQAQALLLGLLEAAPLPHFGRPAPPSPATGPPPAPLSITAQGPHHNSGMTAGAPPGFHTIQGAVPPGVAAKAKSLLNLNFGDEVPFTIDGKQYLARVEHHYHPPGYQGGPNGWHKGVTVYAAG